MCLYVSVRTNVLVVVCFSQIFFDRFDTGCDLMVAFFCYFFRRFVDAVFVRLPVRLGVGYLPVGAFNTVSCDFGLE